jgi:hypothetical protein
VIAGILQVLVGRKKYELSEARLLFGTIAKSGCSPRSYLGRIGGMLRQCDLVSLYGGARQPR